MDTILLQDIPLELDPSQLMEKLRIKEGSSYAADVRRMAEEACDRARPKVVYRPCRILSRGEDYIVLEGETFHSRVLAVNVEKMHRVFPFVATCGTELESWSASYKDGISRLCAAEIKGIALATAVLALLTHLKANHVPGEVSMMNPGSLEDWPLIEQKSLFKVLGNPEEAIGVALLDSYFMTPAMSTSGIWFPAEENFENCMLCQMADCPGRRAPYDRDLYDKKYRQG